MIGYSKISHDELGCEDFVSRKIKHNGYFGMLNDDFKSNFNANSGDRYVEVINFSTGEKCHKKVNSNIKGLFFTHSSSAWSKQKSRGTHYLHDFTKECFWIPYQVVLIEKGE